MIICILSLLFAPVGTIIILANQVSSLVYDNGYGVGVNTTSPVNKFHVNVGDPFTGGNKGITLGSGRSSGADINYSNSESTTLFIDSRYNQDSAAIQFRMKTQGNPSNVMTIKGNGNVGVNTTSPVNKLHVNVGDPFTGGNKGITLGSGRGSGADINYSNSGSTTLFIDSRSLSFLTL